MYKNFPRILFAIKSGKQEVLQQVESTSRTNQDHTYIVTLTLVLHQNTAYRDEKTSTNELQTYQHIPSPQFCGILHQRQLQEVLHWIIMMDSLHPICFHILWRNLIDTRWGQVSKPQE